MDPGTGTRGGRSRSRRIAEVFGDVLPDTTADERESWGERERPAGDEWYYANRPPHHDRDE